MRDGTINGLVVAEPANSARSSVIEDVGTSSPLGATVLPGGTNFSVYSRGASRIELLLFDHQNESQPSRCVSIEPAHNRTYHYWHVFVPRVAAGQIYGYRVYGDFDPANGLRFDPQKLLLDPYGRGVVVPRNYRRDAASKYGSNTFATAMKSVVVDAGTYDWEGDRPLNTPSSRSIIYEMHVKGFTRHPTSGVPEPLRGTYAGLIDKIPYLQDLGITAVELLPVFQFDAQDCPQGLVNYWGYAPVSFFSPHQAYSSRQDPLGPTEEFRDMVKALHQARIEVILDVVYNHTAEGADDGPTLFLRGFDNPAYYILERDQSRYADYSGCGNTLNTNHPVVRRMIVDSLRYWVTEMHVDGFRFDLASILSRDSFGALMSAPPVLWDIESDPELAGTKLIAEAWDAAGLYQVGSFIGDSWKEWNGRFRDDFRSFFRGDGSTVRRIADGFLGSPDIYGHKKREAEQSVNFITCHDGFSLNDLVSYNQKHNEANGQQNRDGGSENLSWNSGVEGPTDNPDVERLRNRQVKNFLTTTVLSLGVPMILMGDEVRRTQWGNNNNYCHDDETAWLDWTLLERHADVLRFVKLLNRRRVLRNFAEEYERKTLSELIQEAHKAWHGVRLFQPDWNDWSHSIALTAEHKTDGLVIYMLLNAYWEPLTFELPEPDDPALTPWRRWIDTALTTPFDIVEWQTSPVIAESSYRAEARSSVVLFRTAANAG